MIHKGIHSILPKSKKVKTNEKIRLASATDSHNARNTLGWRDDRKSGWDTVLTPVGWNASIYVKTEVNEL